MQVDKNKVVSIDYTLTNTQGQVLDTSKGAQPLTYLHGVGGIIPGLESALQSKNPGESLKVSVPPDQGYGEKDPNLVQPVPRANFGSIPNIAPGMQFQAQNAQGSRIVTVVEATPETVTIDANHPLAGQTLNFDVTVVDVRDATAEELAHGHVHGPGGHQH
jgi:FKBP-type peptidyl-prolyl cis-trans isomerase SlyD